MNVKIGIIGLGYVGLPLAQLFAEKYTVIGYDIDVAKIDLLHQGIDTNNQQPFARKALSSLRFSNHSLDLKSCTHLIVTIPTDIDAQNLPDLRPLQTASQLIGKVLQQGMIVVFESTVYPGLTEEICIPIIEKFSGLVWKKDFFVGYSPERINPGESNRPLASIVKIVSADTKDTLDNLVALYGSVITAGIYQAPSIRVAEAAKVIENAQRDLNIAFMNELALIFDLMQLDTRDVLKAAASKWNFLPFEPGLVGGHCIGVDPYYLTYKAEQLGYTPKVIHSGRDLNNQIGPFIAEKLVKTLIAQEKNIAKSRVLVLGCTFKENVNDIRNSKVFDIVNTLASYLIQVDILDTMVPIKTTLPCPAQLMQQTAPDILYDAIILAVKHDSFKLMSLTALKEISVSGDLNLFDAKAFYDKSEAIKIAKYYWRL
jgi:UDP-N-acetyl-D-galactosamine dehydrogenase